MTIYVHALATHLPDGSSTADLLAVLPPGLVLWGELSPGVLVPLPRDPGPLVEGAWYYAEPEGIEPCRGNAS